jgi:hypothetical protein
LVFPEPARKNNVTQMARGSMLWILKHFRQKDSDFLLKLLLF